MVEMIFRVIDNVADNGIIYSSFLISVISQNVSKISNFCFRPGDFQEMRKLICDAILISDQKTKH